MTEEAPTNPVQTGPDTLSRTLDPFGIAGSLLRVQQAWLQHPWALASEMTRLGGALWSVQLHTWQRLMGAADAELIPAAERDERFSEEIWQQSPYLHAVREFYLLYTRWLEDAVFATPEVPEKSRRRAAFWVRQGLNALAPTNFFWTNPTALQHYYRSAGTSLLKGLQNWMKDCARGDIAMVDESAFEVGRNLAATPGEVVFRNELLELIQYRPATAQVHAIPLLVVAPWINKYYILDLNERKSLVRYLVHRGFTVFITSWKNPGADMRQTTFDDYLLRGLLQAIEAVRGICGVPRIHAAGYCIGGTLLAAFMAWCARDEREPSPIAHWTLLTTLVDFARPGDIDVFIDEDGIAAIEKMMEARGYLDGAELALSFRLLRSNSLIWHYYVHNYLYGEEPPQFDVLYWNTDATRLPQAMHSFYLREMYLRNRLIAPDALTLGGRPIDLRRIRAPLYAVGTEQDHIAPWKETFRICAIVGGSVRYVLATSGHIMGVVSPPVDPPKRRYWVGEAGGRQDGEAWRASVPKVPGSWWEDWSAWLAARCEALQEPPGIGDATHPPLAAAPGSYVLER